MMIKVCGITNAADAPAAIVGGATAIGFNFYEKSPRFIAPHAAADIVTSRVRRVGVFVNEQPSVIELFAGIARLDTIQLHGDEEVKDYPRNLVVWKAVRVNPDFSFTPYFRAPAEALLLDGPAADLYGGSGRSFDWALAAGSGHRIIIAGGLDGSNVARAIEIAHPWGVDACSRIESAPGIKDHTKMLDYLRAAKAALVS
jgi:phosphoribosylanthranilate isomerase